MSTTTFITPTLPRRIISMLYEIILLFGVLFVSTWVLSMSLQRQSPYLRHALESCLFLVLALYFIWFWTRSGQTLAMKTWRIKLVDTNNEIVSIRRAGIRFLLCWLWFLPGLILSWILEEKGWGLLWLPMLNIIVWALLVLLDPQRQFLHDRIAGTRLIHY